MIALKLCEKRITPRAPNKWGHRPALAGKQSNGGFGVLVAFPAKSCPCRSPAIRLPFSPVPRGPYRMGISLGR